MSAAAVHTGLVVRPDVAMDESVSFGSEERSSSARGEEMSTAGAAEADHRVVPASELSSGSSEFGSTLEEDLSQETSSVENSSEDGRSVAIEAESGPQTLEDSSLLKGLGEYGCSHYRRRCRIRAPCCNEVFDCRHCHNEAKNSEHVKPQLRHDIPRHQVEFVVCSLCDTEQKVAEVCKNCGVRFGEYTCMECKFFDDDTSKKQYHCAECGICRIGGRENFFHCKTCGCCYSLSLLSGHKCVEKSMHHNCPVCFEFLFDSVQDITVMRCGHTIHHDCLLEMTRHSQYACPMCSKSVYDMSQVWQQLDREVAATPMPPEYRNKLVWILCNDCGESSEVAFHVLAQKCLSCNSYNTRQTRFGLGTNGGTSARASSGAD